MKSAEWTLLGASGAALGSETIGKPFQTGGSQSRASKGTSIASSYLSKRFPQRLSRQIPTPRIGHLRAGTPVVGRALGRFVPILGWGLLAYDGISISTCTANCME